MCFGTVKREQARLEKRNQYHHRPENRPNRPERSSRWWNVDYGGAADGAAHFTHLGHHGHGGDGGGGGHSGGGDGGGGGGSGGGC